MVYYFGATLTWFGRELAGYTKGNKAISYKYDVDGMRYRKVVKENDSVKATYDYVYSDGTLILLTYTQNGVANTARFVYDSFGEPRGFILNDSATYLYLKNGQGDITAIVGEDGEILVRYEYNAWGAVEFVVPFGVDPAVTSNLATVSPFTYRGYCYDYDIGMYYLQSRYYDPEICRFINADSTDYLGATGTVLSYNLFAYCENDGVDCVDETGDAKYSITAVGVQIEISATFLGCAGEVGIEFVFVPKTKKFHVYVYAGAGIGAGYSKNAYDYFKKNLKFLPSKSNVSLTNIKNMFSLNVSFSIGLFLVRTKSGFSWPKDYTKGQSTSNSLSIGRGKVYVSKASNGTYKCYGICIATTGYGVSQSSVVNKQFSAFLSGISSWLKKRKSEIINFID